MNSTTTCLLYEPIDLDLRIEEEDWEFSQISCITTSIPDATTTAALITTNGLLIFISLFLIFWLVREIVFPQRVKILPKNYL